MGIFFLNVIPNPPFQAALDPAGVSFGLVRVFLEEVKGAISAA